MPRPPWQPEEKPAWGSPWVELVLLLVVPVVAVVVGILVT